MKTQEQLLSAGIDIGTSTTKLVFSRFSLMNTASGGHIPRIEIVNKEVLYESPIYKTPLLDDVTIDMEGIHLIVKEEYEKAGISPENIQTGAVIITGETATKHNAEEMVHRLSMYGGEFLVATAGPDLEGIIAAKGSGAYQYSKDTGLTVANIDIGGGTANIAVYQAGRLCGTCTLHIGGRLIEWEQEKVKVAPSIQRWLVKNGWLQLEDCMEEVSTEMAAALARILDRSFLEKDLNLVLGHSPNWLDGIEVLMFSGGVGACVYEKNESSTFFADIGLKLAEALRNNKQLQKWRWVTPIETVRATVLGAGAETTEISGATIEVHSAVLPLRNIPVFRVDVSNREYEECLLEAIQVGSTLFDSLDEGQNFAFYITGMDQMSFSDIQRLANSFIPVINRNYSPLIIVLNQDYGKVLGQTIRANFPHQSVICIDQISVEHGDYLDIGHLLQSGVVPVVVKTLAFHN